MTQQQAITQLEGGLDLITPKIGVLPGAVISAKNYEPDVRGYRRCEGYERFDGRPKPSEAAYYIFDFDDGVAAVSAGETITGATSGATAEALVDAVLETGSYGGGDAAGYLAVSEVSGTFLDNEMLQVSASNMVRMNGVAQQSAAPSNDLHKSYTKLAVTNRRNDIAALPGSGNVLGIATYRDDVYAWRNNVGGTKACMFKATAGGWVEQTFGNVLFFDAGTSAFVEEETVTGGTSGATGTVKRVGLQLGTWNDNAASGFLVLSSVSGTFQDNETLSGSGSGAATANGADSAIEFPAGGRIRTINHNFYGASNLFRLYGASSEGFAFEWDGTVLAPIKTGVESSVDKPKHIAVHAEHLLLGYDGGAVLCSGTGLPLSFLVSDGAAQFSIGESVTGMVTSAARATVIFAENRIAYLTGSGLSDFSMDTITNEGGAKDDTAQMLDQPVYMDQQGLRKLETSEAFGDWKKGTLSRFVQPIVEAKRISNAFPVASQKVRAKDQYRLYWSDGDVLVMYLGKQRPEFLPFVLGFTPTCAASGENSNGDEVLFAGDDAGMVYQIDAGTSFDGASIEAFLRLPWQHQKRPNTVKRYHRLRAEVDSGNDDTTLSIAVEYGYGDPETPGAAETGYDIEGGGGLWDDARWDEFVWGAAVQGVIQAELSGIGPNLSICFLHDSDAEAPHVISSVTVNYTLRRELR